MKEKQGLRFAILAIIMLIVFVLMYYISKDYFLILHTFAEIAGIVVAITIFNIGWFTRKYTNNNFMAYLATGYLIVGILSVFHTLTYKGMNMFPELGANTPTQFWIAIRYVESIAILAAIFGMDKKKSINPKLHIGLILSISVLITISIFTGIFPDCYIEGEGLTKFKIISEYIICAVFFLSIFALLERRRRFEKDIFRYILISFCFKIISEILFTLYKGPYEFINFLGHFFILISIILLYISLVLGNLTRPYKSLFKSVADYAEEIAQTNKELMIKDKAIASSLNAILFSDTDGNITYVNDSFLKLLGYEPEDVLSRSVLEILNASDPIDAVYKKLVETGIYHGEILLKMKDGRMRNCIVTGNYIYSKQEEPVCCMASFIDISEQKELELELIRAKNAAEAANISKGYFLANMSHEIRTPMNGILGFLQLLERSDITNKQKEYIHLIKASSDTLLKIVDDILDFSKIEAGKMELESILFDLTAAVDTTIIPFKAKAEEKGLVFFIHISRGVPRFVIGDPTRLKQVLGNLVSNAVKFTRQGDIRLEVRMKAREGKQITLEFQIADTGIGISQEVLEGLFKPFTQADVSSKRRFGGTGLGLAICKSFVTMMGGKIWVESEEGRGSRFIFDIIVHEDEECGSDPNLEQGKRRVISKGHRMNYNKNALHSADNKLFPANASDAHYLKVLLAEDNEINRYFFVELLKVHNIFCDIAVNGEEAVSACLNGKYDLVFMDCQMPIMDGYVATRKIREAEGDKRHTIIIAMTANVMTDDEEKCLDAGMDDYLSKPVDYNKIARVIEKYQKRRLLNNE